MAVSPRILLVAFLLGSGPARADTWVLPAIDGEISGDFRPDPSPNVPSVHWTVSSLPRAADTRHVVLSLDGPGARLQAEADVNLRTGDGEWVLTNGTLDAGLWFAALGPRLGSAATGLTVAGQVTVAGKGTLKRGKPLGTLELTLANATIQDPKAGWTVGGVALAGEFEFDAALAAFRSRDPFTGSIRRISTSRFGAENLQVRARILDRDTAEILAASIEIAGGNVIAATPVAVPLRPFDVQLDLTFTHIGLQDIAQFVPTAVAQANGVVDGTVHLGWNAAKGIQMGKGRLTLRQDEPATVRLMSFPGLITNNVPKEVEQFYPGLDQVELGKVPIKAMSLEASYSPEGDGEGRQAWVHLSGSYGGAGGRALDLTVNVRGPIWSVMKAMMDSRLHFGSGK